MKVQMNKEKLYRILEICSSLEDVKEDVIKNHDNNLWWPLDVTDYRKRLLIAGLSTRISYNMINSYRKVIYDLNQYDYEQLKEMSEGNLIDIITPLGLANTRHAYVKSMIEFIEKYGDEINSLSNNELIELIANNVKGASYKVAQCCVLYIRDYYCCIMPVDSGMKDVLLPCLGFKEYKGAIGHDLARKEVESLVADLDLLPLLQKNGYEDLTIPKDTNLTWWAHLVMIYYKRHYCNKHKSDDCPIKKLGIEHKCKKK